MEGIEPGDAPTRGERAELPVRRVTVNSIVALNMAYFRKAAGLTQEELGARLGWGKTIVSTAERSWDAKRVRHFSADDLIRIVLALDVPLSAMFLPPEDDGTAFRYEVDLAAPESRELRALLPYVLLVDRGDSPAMAAYRRRLISARTSSLTADGQSPRQVVDDPSADDAATAAAEPHAKEEEEGRAAGYRAAEVIIERAKAAAATLELDAQHRHRHALGDLVRQRDELERRVDDLRAFEREYRVRLRNYLEVQFRDLLAPEPGSHTDRIIDALREEAAERGASRVSAVILREDGTYQQVQFVTDPDSESGDEASESRDEL